MRPILRRSDRTAPSLTASGMLHSGALRLDRLARRAWIGEDEADDPQNWRIDVSQRQIDLYLDLVNEPRRGGASPLH